MPVRALLALGLVMTPLSSAVAQALCPQTFWRCEPGSDGALRCDQELAASRATSEVLLYADSVNAENQQLYHLLGSVSAERADQLFRADRMDYQTESEQLDAAGNVHYQDHQLSMQADSAKAKLASNETDLSNAQFQLRASSANGEASEIRQREKRTELDQVTFSTCAPEQRSWSIEASAMTLNHEEGVGTARDFKLRLGSVPVIYLPYAQFPIDDRRKSGLLAPTLGYNDEGIDIALPYYFNLAPNYDATLTPRIIGDRGFMLGGEFRYLSRRQTGEFSANWLPGDDLAKRDRWRFKARHYLGLGSGWSLYTDAQRVSDDRYFEDFGESLSTASQSVLGSQMALTRRARDWQAGIVLEDYQLIDPSQPDQPDPYRRLPRIFFDGRFEPIGGFRYGIAADLSHFDRDIGVTGQRLDLWPYIGWRGERPWGFVEPRIGYRYTRYDLNDASGPSDPSRSLPIASLDAGLIFERSLNFAQHSWVQTLEPRAFYLYVPDRNQDDLPVFDSAELDFGYSQLFRYNRFTGADRHSDANQLAIGVSTRLLDAGSGEERAALSIGQIHYFDPPDVELPGVVPVDRSQSVLVAEASYNPNERWRLTLAQQWDPELERTRLSSFRANYRWGRGGIASATYRYRPDRIEQIDLAGVVPVSERWSLIGRYNYSLRDNRSFESLFGFEYEACCYALRVLARQYLRAAGFERNTGIYLEVELKGLGTLGRKTGALLERAILGYRESDR